MLCKSSSLLKFVQLWYLFLALKSFLWFQHWELKTCEVSLQIFSGEFLLIDIEICFERFLLIFIFQDEQLIQRFSAKMSARVTRWKASSRKLFANRSWRTSCELFHEFLNNFRKILFSSEVKLDEFAKSSRELTYKFFKWFESFSIHFTE